MIGASVVILGKVESYGCPIILPLFAPHGSREYAKRAQPGHWCHPLSECMSLKYRLDCLLAFPVVVSFNEVIPHSLLPSTRTGGRACFHIKGECAWVLTELSSIRAHLTALPCSSVSQGGSERRSWNFARLETTMLFDCSQT
jgi:hypothetical protein